MNVTTAKDQREGRLLHVLVEHARMQPQSPALTCEGASVNWEELASRILDLGGAISALGDNDKRPVALLGLNGIEVVIAYLATIAAGRCAVPLPVSATVETIAGMIADSNPALIFADATGSKLIPSTGPRVIGIGLAADGVVPFDDFSRSAHPLDTPAAMAPGDDFNIIYSSGTTAQPKGIVHSHAMRFRQAARGSFALSPQSVMLLATPLYSNTTLMPLLATLFHGGQVVLMRKFSVGVYLDLAESLGATHTMLVPVQYQRILADPSFDTRDLSAFVVKQSTGAALSPAIKKDAIARWPGKLLEVYGLTEGGCTCILDVAQAPDKTHTVGRPAPGNDVRIIGETGNQLPQGETGEIVGRSQTMMSRYLNNKDATEAFYWHDETDALFHRTGDIGQFDADGYLMLRDRKKDVIISGGFNIYASDLEHTLLEHPDVDDAAVIAIPSESWGETPLGLIVVRSGATRSAAEVLEWSNARLSKMQRLTAIEIRDALPRSATGKLLKQDLKRPYWNARS
ncbi:class I adenylate-forming enzyme family protein [Pelagibacterium limicola]|uniref:class I adenylate-forming enzyme family protein n=1 Tax=Pelagibacterium limicola TaxID=2791022 RepID=UPI0018AFAF9C|nr:class I adenylate-forming enzyme family protein [Pelagibacterium limicola]